LGLGLASQGGVAIGLSIMATKHLGDISFAGQMPLGNVIILSVAMTTFFIQLIGPLLVKVAIKLSNEAGKNITKDDIIDSLKTKDVMLKDFVIVQEGEPIYRVAEKFANTNQTIFPVVSPEGSLSGILSINDIREIFINRDMWAWIIAADVMQPVLVKAKENDPLRKTYNLMNEFHLTEAIVGKEENGKFIPTGLLDIAALNRFVERERFIRSKPESVPV